MQRQENRQWQTIYPVATISDIELLLRSRYGEHTLSVCYDSSTLYTPEHLADDSPVSQFILVYLCRHVTERMR